MPTLSVGTRIRKNLRVSVPEPALTLREVKGNGWFSFYCAGSA